MDRLIATKRLTPFVGESLRDSHSNAGHGVTGLRCCDHFGVAVQADMTRSVDYDSAYFEKCRSKQYGQIERGRALLTLAAGAGNVLDIGVGCGAFLEYVAGVGESLRDSHSNAGRGATGLRLHGFDVNPIAVEFLKQRGFWLDPYHDALPDGPIAWTLWDVLEHIPQPHELLDCIRVGDSLLASLPIFDDLADVPASRHFRPDEHYYYFTRWGFIKWITAHGFRVEAYNEDETKPDCGRVGIGTFVCRRIKENS